MRDQKRHTIANQVLRFRRWSRKRYAAFVSVTNCVSIGQLSNNVADRLRKKSGIKSGINCVEGVCERIPGHAIPFDPEKDLEGKQPLLDLSLMSVSLTLEPVSPIGILFILFMSKEAIHPVDRMDRLSFYV